MTKYLWSRSVITNDTMLCARGRHAPQRESLAFSERLHSWGGWRRWKWERKGWNGVGLQLTRPTVLLNEIIAFGWHLFTNSCTQNLLAPKGKWWERFWLSDRKSSCPGQSDGWEFRALHVISNCAWATWVHVYVLESVQGAVRRL